MIEFLEHFQDIGDEVDAVSRKEVGILSKFRKKCGMGNTVGSNGSPYLFSNSAFPSFICFLIYSDILAMMAFFSLKALYIELKCFKNIKSKHQFSKVMRTINLIPGAKEQLCQA